LERTIQFVSIARQAVAQTLEQKERAKRFAEENEAAAVLRRNEQVILLAELRLMRDRSSK
jgi:hypothetical protein